MCFLPCLMSGLGFGGLGLHRTRKVPLQHGSISGQWSFGCKKATGTQKCCAWRTSYHNIHVYISICERTIRFQCCGNFIEVPEHAIEPPIHQFPSYFHLRKRLRGGVVPGRCKVEGFVYVGLGRKSRKIVLINY